MCVCVCVCVFVFLYRIFLSGALINLSVLSLSDPEVDYKVGVEDTRKLET